MASTSGVGSAYPQLYQSTTPPGTTTDPATQQQPAGAGAGATYGSGVPAAGAAQALVTAPASAVASAILETMHALMPELSGDQLDTMLLSVVSKIKDAIDATEKDKIKTDTEAKRAALEEKKAKLEEATKKIEEAEAAKKGTNVWDKIKVAFMAVAAALTIVAGLALMFVPGAQLVGAALIMAGTCMAIATVDAIYAMTVGNGKGMFAAAGEKLAKALGADDTTAGWVGMATSLTVQLAMAVTVAAVGVVATVLTGGAAAAVVVPILVGIGQGIIASATAAGDAVVAGVKYEATQKESDAKKTQADAKQLEALTQMIDEMIEVALARLKGAAETMNAMLDAITDGVRDRGETMSHAKLSA